ncbi:MAG: response regulator [Oscillospiraceae bacterium]|nr:response regulator [Oscillospiraceae bacterium]
MNRPNREKMERIPELSAIIGMSDGDYARTADHCVGFARDYPELEQKLQTASVSGDWKQFLRHMTQLCEMLKNIGANDFLCKKIEDFSMDFLTAVSCLSIDIQMASYEADARDTPAPDRVMRQITSGNSSEDLVAPAILAVDDANVYLNRLQIALSATRYKLTCVTSGSEALDHLKYHTPDLFFVDTEMPEMDGYELAAKIRERGIASPIMFLTAKATPADITKAVRLAPADIIVKSADNAQIVERVNRHFNKKWNREI